LFGFVLAFLGAAAFGVALVLFAPLQILFVNYFIQGPIGASLGFDSPTPGLMLRKPRPADQKIFSRAMLARLFIIGAIAGLFTILAYEWVETATDSAIAAQTMAMVMFSMIHIPISISMRHPYDTAFRTETFSNKYLFFAYGWVLLVLVLVTEIGLLQRIFGTEPLTLQQWGVCVLAVVGFFFVSEIVKLIMRLVRRRET
jgi:Ca2+-transporting ATPase